MTLWERKKQKKSTPLTTKVDQFLTEARVIIPGAQALLGFLVTVTLTRAFEQLPAVAKLARVVALFCAATAVILLLPPAALHRLPTRKVFRAMPKHSLRGVPDSSY